MPHKKNTNGRSKSFEALRLGFRALSAVSPALAGTVGARLFLRTRRHTVPARERSFLDQAIPEQLDTPVGTLPLWHWGEDGPPVILVHGWEGRGSQLAAFAPALVEAGFRVVAYDAPGHGEAPGSSSSIVAMAQALQAVARHVGPAAGVIAHSAGAVAATYALSRGLEVERLIYVAPGAGVLDYSRQFARILGIGEATRLRLQQRIEDLIGVSWEEIEPVPLAESMDTPLLLISDRDDREAPLHSVEDLARAWPGASLTVTEGLGHRRILRNREVVREVTAFLAAESLPADLGIPRADDDRNRRPEPAGALGPSSRCGQL